MEVYISHLSLFSRGLLLCVTSFLVVLLVPLFVTVVGLLVGLVVGIFLVDGVIILLVLALLYLLRLLYKVVVLVRADADLTLLSRTLDTLYFDNKVVWVTGASSGSE